MKQENRHINHDFEQAIHKLREEVIAMGRIARLNLDRAMQGLRDRDADLCELAIASDTEADDAECRIDAMGMEILVRFHPFASDLRMVISSMKIVTNLERISDHAVNIAKRAKKILAYLELNETQVLDPLHRIALGLLDRALISYVDRSATLGQSLTAEDEKLDRAEKHLIATLNFSLEQGGDRAEVCMHLIFIARSLERIGDLAVNIGEDAVFLASAKDIRHLQSGKSRSRLESNNIAKTLLSSGTGSSALELQSTGSQPGRNIYFQENHLGDKEPAISVRSLDFQYGSKQVLSDINLDLSAQKITALIGPSNCGKSTLLRCFNRMNDLLPSARVTAGTIHVNGIEIHAAEVNPVELRRRVGMVFQKILPLPGSVYQNVAYGLRRAGIENELELDKQIEMGLRAAALWEEMKDRLDENAAGLSGGQQQRLCIARALAVQPEILLMDEPCSGLDPIATAQIEELIVELKRKFTIVIVTHNMQQATRISDQTAFFHLGKLIEHGATAALFSNPNRRETEDYISGRSS
jgi:phosphate transport system ATP-binding protein